MPTYGYRCQACSHEFERFQKITEPSLTECESCGGAVKKILYPVGIQFKGTGFYVTDYKGNGAAKDANGNSGGSNGSEPKPETKTETKAESASAPTPAGTSESKPAAAAKS